MALPLAITTFFGSSVVSSPKGSAVCTGAPAAGGGAAAAGGAAGLAEGEALAAGAGDGDVAGEGEALAAGEGEVDGAGEGFADVAGAGVGDWANAPERQSEMAAAGITAAKKERKKLVITCLPNTLKAKALSEAPARILAPRARPGSRERAYLTRMGQIRPMTDAS
ncbi:hypothetical protein GCM10007857_68850 [Bradyrhizobium iriomotense]|uniref:Uncharacterized protein n=1 Tax=Bradyrhizobium iriomotense TaxID=441950 RepID=A0ABQ6BC03_9BRAD|nr:hypothetical protein GCM10007857_68850 [Bradyrhizobium iriomotense]